MLAKCSYGEENVIRSIDNEQQMRLDWFSISYFLLNIPFCLLDDSEKF